MTIRCGLRLSVLALLVTTGLVAVSCSESESPTSPGKSAESNRATISGALVAAEPGRANEPLAGVTVRAGSSEVSAVTDEAGLFTLRDVPAGTVELQVRGPGIQSGIMVNAPPGVLTRVTLALNRGRSTVTLVERSNENERDKRTPKSTGTITPAATRTRKPDNDDKTRTPKSTPAVTRTRKPDGDDKTRTPKSTRTPAPTRTPKPPGGGK